MTIATLPVNFLISLNLSLEISSEYRGVFSTARHLEPRPRLIDFFQKISTHPLQWNGNPKLSKNIQDHFSRVKIGAWNPNLEPGRKNNYFDLWCYFNLIFSIHNVICLATYSKLLHIQIGRQNRLHTKIVNIA